jgi:hypothetical protein
MGRPMPSMCSFEQPRSSKTGATARFAFLLVGDGPEKPRLMALGQGLLGLENVEFREPVPKVEVPENPPATADALVFSF